MQLLKLYMVLLGGRPKARNTEQHDIFFGIGTQLKDLALDIKRFWREAAGNVHIDAWREVNCVGEHLVSVEEQDSNLNDVPGKTSANKLFFVNLGGYKENEFEEFHYKVLVIADSLETAKTKAKKTAFYRYSSLPDSANYSNAGAHIDDKYGIDIDEISSVQDILPKELKARYRILVSENESCPEDDLHLGYRRLKDL